ADLYRIADLHDQAVGDIVEDAEHEQIAVAFIRQLDDFLATAGGIGHGLAKTLQLQHGADVDAIVAAAIDGDDLVLSRLRDAAIDRHDLGLDRFERRVRHGIDEGFRLDRQQAIAHAYFLLDPRDDEAVRLVVGTAGALQVHGAEEGGFIADDFAAVRILQRLAGAEYLEVVVVLQVAAHIGDVVIAEHHAILARGDDARRARQFVGID